MLFPLMAIYYDVQHWITPAMPVCETIALYEDVSSVLDSSDDSLEDNGYELIGVESVMSYCC